METVKKVLVALDSALGWILRSAATACMIIVLALFLYIVFLRFFISIFPGLPIFESISEISEFCLVWMVFLGSAELCRQNKHFVVDFLVVRMEGHPIATIIKFITSALTVVFGVAIIFAASDLISRTDLQATYLPFSKGVFYICILITGSVMAIYSFRDTCLNALLLIRLVKGIGAKSN